MVLHFEQKNIEFLIIKNTEIKTDLYIHESALQLPLQSRKWATFSVEEKDYRSTDVRNNFIHDNSI